METKKLIRKDLAIWIYQNQDNLFYKINKSDADRIALLIISFFQENLRQGCKIEIRGFGTFFVKKGKPAEKKVPIRESRFNKKGIKIINVKGSITAKFIPSTVLRRYLNS